MESTCPVDYTVIEISTWVSLALTVYHRSLMQMVVRRSKAFLSISVLLLLLLLLRSQECGVRVWRPVRYQLPRVSPGQQSLLASVTYGSSFDTLDCNVMETELFEIIAHLTLVYRYQFQWTFCLKTELFRRAYGTDLAPIWELSVNNACEHKIFLLTYLLTYLLIYLQLFNTTLHDRKSLLHTTAHTVIRLSPLSSQMS